MRTLTCLLPLAGGARCRKDFALPECGVLKVAYRARAWRRKEAYEALHPETKQGNPGVSRQVGDIRVRADTERFTADTAKKTGQSETAVQRDAPRAPR